MKEKRNSCSYSSSRLDLSKLFSMGNAPWDEHTISIVDHQIHSALNLCCPISLAKNIPAGCMQPITIKCCFACFGFMLRSPINSICSRQHNMKLARRELVGDRLIVHHTAAIAPSTTSTTFTNATNTLNTRQACCFPLSVLRSLIVIISSTIVSLNVVLTFSLCCSAHFRVYFHKNVSAQGVSYSFNGTSIVFPLGTKSNFPLPFNRRSFRVFLSRNKLKIVC